MQVALHLDPRTGDLEGIWFELPGWEEALACLYRDETSISHAIGVDVMSARSPMLTWHEYWAYLAGGSPYFDWWEVAEVDDESYPEELLYDIGSCHPRPVAAPHSWWPADQVDQGVGGDAWGPRVTPPVTTEGERRDEP